MLKGSYTAIFVSVLLHLLLLFAVIYGSTNAPKTIKQDKTKVSSIKSFLYVAPKKVAPKKVVPNNILTKKTVLEQAVPEKTIKKTTTVVKSINEKKVARIKPSKQVTAKAPPSQVTNAVKSDMVTTKNKVAGVSRGGFSSYDRLSRLRKKLDYQQRDQAFAEQTQKRSLSSMDGEPFPVPKTLVPLTADQQRKLNTSQSHISSITKNDNGTCTIHREQILGSPVEATTSYFACGESNFDKSFRLHMEKVQAKLPIKR